MMTPVTLARLIQALLNVGEDRKALVVGCGSGYSAAILARLFAHVVAVEEDRSLAQRAREALARLGGGCQVPIGAHCRAVASEAGDEYEVLGAVGDPAPAVGSPMVIRGRQVGAAWDGAETLGRRLAQELMGQGAARLIASVAAAGAR